MVDYDLFYDRRLTKFQAHYLHLCYNILATPWSHRVRYVWNFSLQVDIIYRAAGL